MVGFDPEHDLKLSKLEYGMAGAVSSTVARAIYQPLDVLKIRFQIQLEPVLKSCAGFSKYTGTWQACKLIVKEEGLSAMWKGHISAQLLSVIYGGVQFISFELMTQHMYPFLPALVTVGPLKPFSHFVSGGVAGCMATVACQPFDVLRTRFVAQGEPKTYKSYMNACSTICRLEGPLAFYKGLVPTLVQIAPQAGFLFGFYSLFKLLWNKAFKNAVHSFSVTDTIRSLLCGSASGICAKIVVYPLDLSKKRLQIQGFEAARRSFGDSRRYRGWSHCIASVAREEGVRGLYKGLTPSVFKAAIATGLHFTFYELACNLFALKETFR